MVMAPSARSVRSIGNRPFACSSAASMRDDRPASPASRMFEGLPSFVPLAFLIAKAAFVRSEMSRRSFSASAAYRLQDVRHMRELDG